MRLTRISLRNYRVYEDAVDLEIPPGLVGIYGPNGAGKSALIESVRFALYGRSRTGKEEVRTAGVTADCVAEVEFEHEGHLYTVRRTVSGMSASVRAQATADGLQVAEGVLDTNRYVHSVLGMDDAAFRASVFAEQNQLAAFSQQAPADRRRLVLQLLGITPVDAARDQARKDAKTSQQQFERVREVLPDLEVRRVEAEKARADAAELEERAAAQAEAAAALERELEMAHRRHADLDVRRQEHERVAAEAAGAERELAGARERAARLEAELADLERAAATLGPLVSEAEGLEAAEARLRAVEAVAKAERELAATVVPPEPERPDEDGCEAARTAAEVAGEAAAALQGELAAALAERDRAHAALERSGVLTGEAACPLCGQALGSAFEQVRAHRLAELAEAEKRVREIEGRHREEVLRANEAAAAARGFRARLRTAQADWSAWQKAVERRNALAGAAATALAGLAGLLSPSERERCGGMDPGHPSPAEVAEEVGRRRRAAAAAAELRGRLERRGAVVAELEAERELMAAGAGRLEALSEKAAVIDFSPAELARARAERDRLESAVAATRSRTESARWAAVEARVSAEAAAERLADARAQHDRLAQLGDVTRHLGRLAELLNAFRNQLVGTVGPRLATQAAELFGELTDHEYDRLEVDPESYEILIRDGGVLYGMSRFSGSETDLANLALRVAISEHVRFQAGGAVGLLVLDEVFGPLDPDRKERMLLALERLRSRFRQVLVVTHDTEIKEQLPSAIEVAKLPGRRATARVLHG